MKKCEKTAVKQIGQRSGHECPLVSVIIPAYNVQNHIAGCLSSVLRQTYQNFEIIVCDDCSTDRTVKVIEKFLKDTRIKLLKNKKNLHQAAARNRCIQASRGKYIMMQDADDLAKPERIEKLIHAFDDEIDFVGSGCCLFNEDGVFDKMYGKCPYPSAKDLLFRLPFVHASMMFRRECLVAVGGYRISKTTNRGEDYDLIMRLYADGYKGKNINTVLYGYRVDQAAYARRTFKARLDECVIRYEGFKANHILLPFGWIYIFKPLPAHFVQMVRNFSKGVYSSKKERISRVILSFDDGRADNYTAAMDILLKKKMIATFNIATAYIDQSISKSDVPCSNPGMSVKDVVQIEKSGFEIASHGNQHNNSMNDIKKSINKLYLWSGKRHQQGFGFASPCSNLKEADITANRSAWEKMGIEYVRIGARHAGKLSYRCIRRAAQITKSVHLYQAGFGSSLEHIGETYIIHSIPIMHKATLEQVQGIVQLAVRRKKDCVLMFHSILKKGAPYYEDTWSWDYDDFVVLCDWLLGMERKKKIQITSTMEALNS